MTVNSISNMLTALFLFGCLSVFAQPGVDMEVKSNITALACDTSTSNFIILGSSSLHDWEMVSNSCKGVMELDLNGKPLAINSIRINVKVTSLKSGKNIMDKKCYDALKFEGHPDIIYNLSQITSLKSEGANQYSALFEGTLNIAGIVKPVKIDVTLKRNDNHIAIEGAKDLKMSDFGVEPPRALLGTLKTGNDITINFNLNFIE